jgi:hypothetical protein
MTPFELEGMAILETFMKSAGLVDIHSKRPGNLGYWPFDSPIGLLACNAEPFCGFDGRDIATTDRDRYLNHALNHWFTKTAESAADIDLTDARSGAGTRAMRNDLPTGVAVFPRDLRSVRSSPDATTLPLTRPTCPRTTSARSSLACHRRDLRSAASPFSQGGQHAIRRPIPDRCHRPQDARRRLDVDRSR